MSQLSENYTFSWTKLEKAHNNTKEFDLSKLFNPINVSCAWNLPIPQDSCTRASCVRRPFRPIEGGARQFRN
jgi:hypothetical protein